MKKTKGYKDLLRYYPISPRFAVKENTMKSITPQEFLELVDTKWKFIAKDEDGAVLLLESIPKPAKKKNMRWWIVDGEFIEITSDVNINIEWPSEDWRECLVEREPDLSDMIGKIVVGYVYKNQQEFLEKINIPELYKDLRNSFVGILKNIDNGTFSIGSLCGCTRVSVPNIRVLTAEEKELLA